MLGGFWLKMRDNAAVRVEEFRDTGFDFRRGDMRLANCQMVIENEMELHPMRSTRVPVAKIMIRQAALLFHLAVE